ncbi:MAG: gephyrin-like molybdotransferase Glp [Cyclobacteriaceae bacterium]
MITIEEALEKIHDQQVKTIRTYVSVSEVTGYYLAETIYAPIDLPDFDNSAMDGYAVCGLHESYQIVGEIAAGDTANHQLQDGQAMRIFTGSKVPEKATAVVMQEKTQVLNSSIVVKDEIKAGQHIRKIGAEIFQGQKVFDIGHFINPASTGVIASLGIDTIKVYKKPIVNLIITGNELIAPGQTRKPGQVYESNSYSINAALQKFGFKRAEIMQISDAYGKTREGIRHFLELSDLLLISGGISVGDYDYVARALLENGVEEVFYRVFQKPGKPLFFGRKENKFVFALPGNPASSLSCFYIYVLPLLQKLSGAIDYALPQLKVPISHDYQWKGDRPGFLKARVENQKVSILQGQGSSMIYSMATGNALVLLEPNASLKSGDMVNCILI